MSQQKSARVRQQHEEASVARRGSSSMATRLRAAREHQGSRHWHVRRRSTVIVCRACGERIPRSMRPSHCPGCGAGEA